MPTMLYPNVGSLAVAGAIQTLMANSEIHLFKDEGLIPSAGTTLAELVAIEADYTGYAPATVTAWLAPILSPFGGAQIGSGTRQFATASPYTVDNVVAGWWVETAGGVLIAAGLFPTPIAFLGAGAGVPVDLILIFGG